MLSIDKGIKSNNRIKVTYFEIKNPEVVNTYVGSIEEGEWLIKAINNMRSDDLIYGRIK